MNSTQYNSAFGEYRTLTSFVEELSTEQKFDELRTFSGLKLDSRCRFIDGGASLTKTAMDGLCRLTGLPPSMVAWLQDNDYRGDLATYINSKLLERDCDDQFSNRPSKRVLTRFRKNSEDGSDIARALFSDRYAALDSSMLLQMVSSALTYEEQKHAAVTTLDYDGDELLCNMVWPGCDRVVGGESYRVGISISNSETGVRRLQIRPWVGRLVCSNNLIVNSPISDGVSKRHVGRIDLTQLSTSIRTTVGSALALADRALVQLDAGRQIGLENVEKIIVSLGRENGLTIEQVRRWVMGHEQTLCEASTGGVSAFSVVNGLTRSVQQPEVSATERAQLEAMAGRITAPNLEATFTEIEASWRRTELKANLLSDAVMLAYKS
jgi:hypothetical protein